MSSYDAERHHRCFSGRLAIAGMVLMTVALAGCTVTPFYSASAVSWSSPGDDKSTDLASIEIAQEDDRVGQEVRNHLIFLFGGGRGQPANPVYTLHLGTYSSVSQGPSFSVSEVTVEATSALIILSSNYRLVETATGRLVSSGKRIVQASLDIPKQNYAARRAVRDAENRAARELAETLRLVVAQELKLATTTNTPHIVVTPEDVGQK